MINKERRRKYEKQYRLDHKEQLKNYRRLYYQEHKEESKQYSQKYIKQNPGYGKKYHEKYKVKHNEDSIEYYRNHKKLYKGYNLKKYGLTVEEYEKLYQQQNGKCAICYQKYEVLAVDHDHKTGKIRGLLCRKCNMILGAMNDNPQIYLNILKYLEDNMVT